MFGSEDGRGVSIMRQGSSTNYLYIVGRGHSGSTIFSRLNAAGTQRIVRGTPPLSLVVGNASSVRVRYHDKPVDLQPHTNINADVARITLE